MTLRGIHPPAHGAVGVSGGGHRCVDAHYVAGCMACRHVVARGSVAVLSLQLLAFGSQVAFPER